MTEILNLNSYILKHKNDFILSVLFNFIRSIPFVGVPYTLGIILDRLEQGVTSGNLDVQGILNISYLFLSLGMVGYISHFISQFLSARFISIASEDIRSDVFRKLQIQSHKYFDEEGTGDLVSKATTDVASIINFYQQFTSSAGLMVGQFIFSLAVLFSIHRDFGIIGALAMPIMFFVVRFFRKRFTPLQLAARNKYGEISSVITENVDSSILNKIFNTQKRNIDNLNALMLELKEINIKSTKMQAALTVQGSFLTNSVIGLFFIVGGLKVFGGDVSIGGVITVVFVAQYLRNPIRLWGTIGIYRSVYKASETRLERILAYTPHVQNPENGRKVSFEDLKGSLEFKDVSFAFDEKDVLSNINLQIPEGGSIAILGASGSGKSALINLIPRFYDVKTGRILIDNYDITEYDLYSIRRLIGFVDQETFLFSKTMKENIAFGKPEASLEEVIDVAKIAQIHDFIDSLPEKYNTVIGERGVNLSGGQRQRISIARALLYNPKIVIFDDSLSAVDIITENLIQTALDALLKNRTVIFVTQRLSTVSTTDMNIIMSDGKIVEKGTHADLLARNGVYTKLFETQIDGILDLSVIDEVVQ